MRNNETGEFELLVGNRQLLAGFFIVVLLFAVAFAMGYILGQSSPRTAKVQADAAPGVVPQAASDVRPQPVSPALPVAAPAAPQTGDAAAGPGGTPGSAGSPADAPPQPTTQPAREPAAAPPPPAPVPVVPAPAPEAPGSYWQVMAVNPTEAEVVVRTLKDKGFPASMTPGPNNLMRVLVGPYGDTQAMGRAKTALENAGFHPIRK